LLAEHTELERERDSERERAVWRVYLLDRPFMVETDHKSIDTILTQKTTNRRVARWFNDLAEFHPQFKWLPGSTSHVTDALSPNPDFEHKAAEVSLEDLLYPTANRVIVLCCVDTEDQTQPLIRRSDRRLMVRLNVPIAGLIAEHWSSV
jgi:hypothetical protein